MSNDGIKNATSFVVLQGYVISIGHQCRVNSPTSGLFDVKWKDKRLPDGVKIGAYVTLTGQLITLDLGRAFVIIKGELLKPSSLPRFKNFIKENKVSP